MAGGLHPYLFDGDQFWQHNAFRAPGAAHIEKLREAPQKVDYLETLDISFVDVGMGLELVDGSLGGILRVTASTPEKRDHVHSGRISFTGGGEDHLYSSNIQIAELNALNAAMAIIKWKKIRGFYRDLEREHHSTYTTDGNMLLNSDLE